MTKYKRILVKLSGEALADKQGKKIINAERLKNIAQDIRVLVDTGAQVCIVIGAGNIWRGKLADEIGIERTTADYMGMLGTIINSLALQSALQNIDVDSRVMSSLEVKATAEPYIRKKAIRHLEKGRVVIFAGGTGNPYFSTDTAATLRAIEVGCEIILMAKNGVDGVYDDDPRKNSKAKLIKQLTFHELIEKNLEVMDQTAVSLVLDKDIIIKVFDMNAENSFQKVISDDAFGTTIRRK